MLAMLQYTAGPIAIVMLFALGLALVGLARVGLAVVYDFPTALAPGQACRVKATPERTGAHCLRLDPGLPAWDLRASL